MRLPPITGYTRECELQNYDCKTRRPDTAV
ncbi:MULTISPECIES: hypothetical protein [Bacteroides]